MQHSFCCVNTHLVSPRTSRHVYVRGEPNFSSAPLVLPASSSPLPPAGMSQDPPPHLALWSWGTREAFAGTISGLEPDEGHRDTRRCWRRARGYCPSPGLGSARGFGPLGTAACRREALDCSSICFGWTPRGIWEFCTHRSFPSPPPLSLPPAPRWFWTPICHSIP